MVSQFQLIMRSGPTPGASFILEGDQLTIGRDAANEIVINDAEISRRHARLTFQGGKYVLEDLGSTNGTFVNGQRLAGPRVLKAGEVVSFGEQIVLVFEASTIDSGATMVSPRAAAAVPSAPRPSTPPPPPAEYAGSVPASPAPMGSVPAKKMNLTPIIIGVVVFLMICCCISIFVWVDADKTGARWCTFPFSILAQLLGSTCP
ncbi:MAG TPA: FHA domain-containing protein [Anaerolineales bacterium]|nr:FHA domain-containing protein [Anaerolineales bacterium]